MKASSLKYGQAVLLLCLLMAVPVFGFLSRLPIQLWDEARLANTAIEMLHTHNWLIPTYGYQPDLWSTKPPLMIWLQALSIKAFGINELAVRLPSALAAFTLVLGLYFFIARLSKKPLLGLTVTISLLSTLGYITLHVTRTADYDSLLTALICFAACSFFSYLHSSKSISLYALFLFLAFGVLTKGVAALLITPAFILFALHKRKFISILSDYHTYIGFIVFVCIVGGYYFFRYQSNPQYLQAVWENELWGRMATAKENNSGNDWYYIHYLFFHGYRYYIPFAIFGVIGMMTTKDKILKDIGVFSLLIIVCHQLVISLSATKLYWYVAPEYPFLAILSGLGIYFLGQFIVAFNLIKRQQIATLVLLLLVFSFPYYWVVRSVALRPIISSGSDSQPMALYLKTVLDGKPIFKNATLVWDGYVANLEFYRKALRAKKIPFSYNDGQSLLGHEKVIVYKDEIKQMIIDKFATNKIDSFHNVVVYQLHGLK